MERDNPSRMLRSALRYIERHSFFVLPLDGKRPLGTLVPHGHLNATQDKGVTRDWWGGSPNAGVGVSVAPSGLCVLDIDPRNLGDESFDGLIKEFGPLPVCPHVLTGGGGAHYYFKRHPMVRKNIVGLMPGIDLKVEGYVVAPPSCHPNGTNYAWSVDGHIDEIKPAQMPEWLVGLCGSGPRKPHGERQTLGDDWSLNIIDGAQEGTRNQTLASLVGHLLRRWVNPHIALTLVHAWNKTMNKPPLSEAEVNRTAESIALKEIQRRTGLL